MQWCQRNLNCLNEVLGELSGWRDGIRIGSLERKPFCQFMAATVSPASTWRLVSDRAGLSGKPALVEGVGPLEALGTGAGVEGCTAGPLKASGRANTDGEVMMAGTDALLTAALWRPTEQALNAVSLRERVSPCPASVHSSVSRKSVQAVRRACYTIRG